MLVLVVYGGLLYLTVWSFGQMPTGFIPDQDQGYLLGTVQLPDSASLERTDEAMVHGDKIVRSAEGVAHAIRVSGMSFVLGANGSHLGTMFIILKPFEERDAKRATPSRPSFGRSCTRRSKRPGSWCCPPPPSAAWAPPAASA